MKWSKFVSGYRVKFVGFQGFDMNWMWNEFNKLKNSGFSDSIKNHCETFPRKNNKKFFGNI